MERIRAFFENRIEINDDTWELFTARISKRDYAENSTLIHVGTTENNLSFIAEGIVRAYIPNQGNDITFDIAFQNQFVSAYDSFLTRNPSTYKLETLTNTTLLAITHADIQQLYHQRKIGNIIGRLASENIFERIAGHQLDLINHTPEEIYTELKKRHRDMIDEVPHTILASYLGITVATLARIESAK